MKIKKLIRLLKEQPQDASVIIEHSEEIFLYFTTVIVNNELWLIPMPTLDYEKKVSKLVEILEFYTTNYKVKLSFSAKLNKKLNVVRYWADDHVVSLTNHWEDYDIG